MLPLMESQVFVGPVNRILIVPKEWASTVRKFVDALNTARPGEAVPVPDGITPKAAAVTENFIQLNKEQENG